MYFFLLCETALLGTHPLLSVVVYSGSFLAQLILLSAFQGSVAASSSMYVYIQPPNLSDSFLFPLLDGSKNQNSTVIAKTRMSFTFVIVKGKTGLSSHTHYLKLETGDGSDLSTFFSFHLTLLELY